MTSQDMPQEWTGRTRFRLLRETVEQAEEGIRENRSVEDALRRQIAEIEQQVLAVWEWRNSAG